MTSKLDTRILGNLGCMRDFWDFLEMKVMNDLKGMEGLMRGNKLLMEKDFDGRK